MAQEAKADDPEAFFREYAAACERSLGEHVDVAGIRSFFAEAFISARVNGKVAPGLNDESFDDMLRKGYAFYKAIGTASMKVDRVEAEALYENHDRVKVFYSSTYRKKDGAQIAISFDVLYLLQRRPDGPKIFGFVTGDEMAVFKAHGLVDEAGQPA